MTNWKYNVYLADLRDEYDKDDDDNIDVKKCVVTVYDRLLLLKTAIEKDGDPDSIIDGINGLDSCIDDFHYFDFYASQKDQIDQFNYLMDELYDFADYNFIWLNTFDKRAKSGIGKVESNGKSND